MSASLSIHNMRFFKSFTLLHRRTKSDPLLSNALPVQPEAYKRASLSSHPQSDGPSNSISGLPCPPHRSESHIATVNLRIFDLQVENTRLQHVACIASAELAQVKAQLHATRSELIVELHRSARNTKAYTCEIERLQSALADENRLFTIPENLARRPNSQDTRRNFVSTSGSATSLSSIEASYLSSLRMTLDTRKDLRESKKVAKFWKRVAQQENPASEVVTPSSSNLSSIYEPLSAERQSAVDLLIAKRTRASVERLDPETTSNLIPIQPPSSQNTHRFDLPPLASQSFRQEMSSISSKTLLLERSFTLQNVMRAPNVPYSRKGKLRRSTSRARCKTVSLYVFLLGSLC